jgi:hypothetical protein
MLVDLLNAIVNLVELHKKSKMTAKELLFGNNINCLATK